MRKKFWEGGWSLRREALTGAPPNPGMLANGDKASDIKSDGCGITHSHRRDPSHPSKRQANLGGFPGVCNVWGGACGVAKGRERLEPVVFCPVQRTYI